MKRLTVFSLLILCIAASSAAQQKDLARERVRLLFKQVPVAQVLPALAKSLGYELSLDPTLRALVSIELENVTAETALNAICESIGCRWRRDGSFLVVEARTDTVATLRPTKKGKEYEHRGGNLMGYSIPGLDGELPFEISWAPVDIQTAFFMLARMTNADVEVAPALQHRKLAATIKAGSLRQAFDTLCAVADCRWQLIEQPKRVVRVTERTDTGSSAVSSASAIYRPSDVGVRSPVLLSEVKPQYTPAAKNAKIQGTVWLEAVVLPDGSLTDVRIVKSLDREYGLDEEALRAARAWRFMPGTRDGRPVPVSITIELSFALK